MIRRILMSMDVLLDTRLGVMANLNKEAAAKMVANRDYYDREYDDWFVLSDGLVTNEQFADAYAQRGGINTAATLNASFETGIAPFLYQLLSEADINTIDGMTAEGNEIGLAINTAPYTLSISERADLVSIIQAKYGHDLQVKLVNYQLHELTVERLADEFCGLIIYEFAEWFKYHHLAITGALLSDFNVIHPKLFDADPSELTVDDRKQAMIGFRLITQHNLDINFIDAKYFSVIDVKNLAAT